MNISPNFKFFEMEAKLQLHGVLKQELSKLAIVLGCERVPSLILQSCNYVDVFMFYILSTIIYLLSNGLNLSFLTFSLIIICPLHIAWPFWARTAERHGWFSIVNPICESSKTLANTKNIKIYFLIWFRSTFSVEIIIL